MTVAELLAASRAAHARYREIHNRTMNGDAAGMLAALTDAATQRQAADDADPTHLDPAWTTDAETPWHTRATRGVPHDELRAFYTQQLTSLSSRMAAAAIAIHTSAVAVKL